MAELTKIDPPDLLGQVDSAKNLQRIVDFIKLKGFKDEADLMANGTAEDKVLLQKYIDIADLSQDHHNCMEKWLNLINSLVDNTNEVEDRIVALENKQP